MLRGRRERGSSSSIPSTSLLIPPNPAVADPGSSPTSRGGILLNPLNKDGSPTTSLPSDHPSTGSVSSLRSSSLSSNTSRNIGNGVAKGYYASRGGSNRRSASLSGYNSHSPRRFDSNSSNNEDAISLSSATTTSTSPSPRLKFAPLPESGRIKRSNSITLGVAARAQLLQGNGMGGGGGGAPAPSAPHWQQQVYNPNSTGPMWYNGGPIPDNVKTFKDIKPGIKKAWGAIRRRRSSSNASSASTTSSVATNESESESGKNGGNAINTIHSQSGSSTGSEADISSINEEDEEEENFVDTPPSTVGYGSSSNLGNSMTSQSQQQSKQGQGPEGMKLTGEGLVVKQPPGAELGTQQATAGAEGGQPPRRQDSDAYSLATSINSEAISEASSASSASSSDLLTDSETQGAYTSRQGLSESPSYTPGMGHHGHFYPSHHSHNHHHNHHYNYDGSGSGTRSGEATPRRGHSPPSSPGNGPSSLSRTYSNRQQQQQHWTPHIGSENTHAGGSGSASPAPGSMPGSGANTPRRRMSLGDINSSHNSRKGASVFGFDEMQLKNRLGAMDLNSRRRRPHLDEEEKDDDDEEEQKDKGSRQAEDEDEVPLPVDSRQVKGAGLEIAV